MTIQFNTTFKRESCGWYLFHSPCHEDLKLIVIIANIVFHILTLGIPFLFYHVVSYCLAKYKDYVIWTTVHKTKQNVLMFARQTLLENIDIKGLDWDTKNQFPRCKISRTPDNDDISRLAALYWDKYAVEFQDILKAHSRDGKDPWASEEVLVKAEEWLKIGCSMVIFTIKDLESRIASVDDAREVKMQVISSSYWYASQVMYYFLHTYAVLKIGLVCSDDNSLKFPSYLNLENIYLKPSKLFDWISSIKVSGRPEFYQKGTRQAAWRKLYNDTFIMLFKFFGDHFQIDVLTMLDNNPKAYEASSAYLDFKKLA